VGVLLARVVRLGVALDEKYKRVVVEGDSESNDSGQ